jgi:hypothetical protein
MAGGVEPSPLEPIHLNNTLRASNGNGPTSLDLGNNDDLSEFGTPLNAAKAPKTPNILHNDDCAAATATQPKTERVLFTDQATNANVTVQCALVAHDCHVTDVEVPQSCVSCDTHDEALSLGATNRPCGLSSRNVQTTQEQ